MLDYIHSAETEQFSFLRVPKILLQNDTFKGISAEAKLLYSILFDRTELSNRNGWRDDQDRVHIIFTIAEITESMNCGNKKAIQATRREGLTHEVIRLTLSDMWHSEPRSVSGRDGRVDGMREMWKCHTEHGT